MIIELEKPNTLFDLGDRPKPARQQVPKGFRVRGDQIVRVKSRTQVRDARNAQRAAQFLQSLPANDESVHFLLSGLFRTWDVMPACVRLAGCKCEEMHLTTLGYDDATLAGILKLYDEGTLGRVSLACADVFRYQEGPLYDATRMEFERRCEAAKEPTCRIVGVRNHCKVYLMRFADGRKLAIESSGNLRSCHSMESLTIFGSPDVYDFHRKWIEQCFAAGAAGRTQIVR